MIDASGLIVSPGFIDVHTHADNLVDRPAASNFVRMGVTTIVAGNCGGSALDVGAALSALRESPGAVNFATLIGHNTIRTAVMGSENRAPRAAELARMRSLVWKAMADGAIGFSTGLQYVPGTYAQHAGDHRPGPRGRQRRRHLHLAHAQRGDRARSSRSPTPFASAR